MNSFEKYRNNIVGIEQEFESPYGVKRVIYADWVASGRLYRPIEEKILNDIGPFVGNTHSESSVTGTSMTHAYHEAKSIIRKHVNASKDDVLITAGFGMTAVVNKLQRILGLRISEKFRKRVHLRIEERPVVFITHMEHHSNQTSWLETIAEVVIIEPSENGLVEPENLREKLHKYKDRAIKIGSFTAASNVTGIIPDYHKLARIMHEYDGVCFVDFAAAAPYVEINMHPSDPMEKLDAIFFSPHKFLGGPGTSGILIFDHNLYQLKVPDHPGGGTVDWTNPWGQHKYIDDIESREDGGTPGFIQAIKSALCIKLKEQMGVANILSQEHLLLNKAIPRFKKMDELHILAQDHEKRLGIISFYSENVHYNLMVKILNDRYGVQVRGGCSCAGTYGHYLLHVDPTRSKRIANKINHGDLSEKPGWVRFSLHPTMTENELDFVLDAIEEIIINAENWKKDYNYSKSTNEYSHKSLNSFINKRVQQIFTF